MSGLGYSTRCRACNSANRVEIDRRLLGGDSARAVAGWLVEACAEKIPFQALANHKAEHLDVKTEALSQIAAALPVFVTSSFLPWSSS